VCREDAAKEEVMKGRHRQKRVWEPFRNADFPEAFRQLNEVDPHYVGVFLNNLYQVTMRETPDGVTWLAIVRVDRQPVDDWRDKQRIKNELCGSSKDRCLFTPTVTSLTSRSM
jgi:hypothetical protein